MNHKAFVYSPKYNFHLENHVFKTTKYPELYSRLINEKLIDIEKVIEPTIRDDFLSDLQLVHSQAYLDDLLSCKKTPMIRSKSTTTPVKP